MYEILAGQMMLREMLHTRRVFVFLLKNYSLANVKSLNTLASGISVFLPLRADVVESLVKHWSGSRLHLNQRLWVQRGNCSLLRSNGDIALY